MRKPKALPPWKLEMELSKEPLLGGGFLFLDQNGPQLRPFLISPLVLCSLVLE